uniref:Si:dkey-14o18.2 n=1 Tax=Poecilia latipinna TaxID=48699 RepID=A0A3B3UB98_9TELE
MYEQKCGPLLPLFPLHSLIFYYFLSCAAAVGTIEYDYGISPKFVCTPVPPEADPSCYSPPSVPHGPSNEAKATILHLRESLVRQKETILDQRETIRELTAKLTLCEGFGGHHSIGHHESHHGYQDNHDTHHEQTGKTLQTLKERLENLQVSEAKLISDFFNVHFDLNSKLPSAFLLEFPMRTNYMYARMKRSVVNEIFALTICLWLKPGEGSGLGTPISYAVPGQANELVLMEWGSNPMELLINDKVKTFLTDGKWHHVCVTWSTRDGVWEAYQDGVKKGSGQNLSAWNPIKPGGIFMLGQEQDTMGGRFDITQSFLGELSDLQFWSRVLTANEIHTQATCGSHLVGDVLSWSEEQLELHGGLTELPFEPCH